MGKGEHIPGVAVRTIEDESFYVDSLWAMGIGSRAELEEIVSLEQPDMSRRLREVSLSDIMRKAYTIAEYLIDKRENSAHNQQAAELVGKLIDWYYHGFSPRVVNWQLDHPAANRHFTQFTESIMDAMIKILNLDVLDDEGVFEVKHRLRGYKTKTNYSLQRY